MVIIEFNMGFDVDGDALAYERFIRSLRTRLHGGGWSHGLPILPRQEISPEHWFEVVLRTSLTSTVTLRIRSDNLHVDAFRAGTDGA
jgi:hypothetical protein